MNGNYIKTGTDGLGNNIFTSENGIIVSTDGESWVFNNPQTNIPFIALHSTITGASRPMNGSSLYASDLTGVEYPDSLICCTSIYTM